MKIKITREEFYWQGVLCVQGPDGVVPMPQMGRKSDWVLEGYIIGHDEVNAKYAARELTRRLPVSELEGRDWSEMNPAAEKEIRKHIREGFSL